MYTSTSSPTSHDNVTLKVNLKYWMKSCKINFFKEVFLSRFCVFVLFTSDFSQSVLSKEISQKFSKNAIHLLHIVFCWFNYLSDYVDWYDVFSLWISKIIDFRNFNSLAIHIYYVNVKVREFNRSNIGKLIKGFPDMISFHYIRILRNKILNTYSNVC